jgi:hypothetical protein
VCGVFSEYSVGSRRNTVYPVIALTEDTVTGRFVHNGRIDARFADP